MKITILIIRHQITKTKLEIPKLGYTFAGTDEEKPIRRDWAIEQTYHRPRMTVANKRNSHLLLVH